MSCQAAFGAGTVRAVDTEKATDKPVSVGLAPATLAAFGAFGVLVDTNADAVNFSISLAIQICMFSGPQVMPSPFTVPGVGRRCWGLVGRAEAAGATVAVDWGGDGPG